MRILTKMLKQTCVYWALASDESGGLAFDDYGQPSFTDPVEISCRWEDVLKEIIGVTGTKEISHSTVYVGQDVLVGGVLMLGELTDITDDDNPRENEGAAEIKSFGKLPTLKGNKFLRTAYL